MRRRERIIYKNTDDESARRVPSYFKSLYCKYYLIILAISSVNRVPLITVMREFDPHMAIIYNVPSLLLGGDISIF